MVSLLYFALNEHRSWLLDQAVGKKPGVHGNYSIVPIVLCHAMNFSLICAENSWRLQPNWYNVRLNNPSVLTYFIEEEQALASLV